MRVVGLWGGGGLSEVCLWWGWSFIPYVKPTTADYTVECLFYSTMMQQLSAFRRSAEAGALSQFLGPSFIKSLFAYSDQRCVEAKLARAMQRDVTSVEWNWGQSRYLDVINVRMSPRSSTTVLWAVVKWCWSAASVPITLFSGPQLCTCKVQLFHQESTSAFKRHC